MTNMERIRGTLGVMWMDCVRGKFVKSLVDLVSYTQQKFSDDGKGYMHIVNAGCSYHQLARNNLVEQMEGDWIFMTDTDHAFAPDLLIRLLNLAEKHKAKVISGIYQSKYPPHDPVACLWYETEGKVKALPIKDWNRNAEVLQLPGGVGGGCLLIYREVFNRIKTELGEDPFTEYPGLSEDYSFCYRCKKLGIPVFLAPNVESHHIIDHVLSVEDHVPMSRDSLKPFPNATIKESSIIAE